MCEQNFSAHGGPIALREPFAQQKVSYSFWSCCLGLWRAARWKKNIPLVFLLLGGGFSSGQTIAWEILVVALFTLLMASALMTHINILTDAELDQNKKPHLYQWLSINPRFTALALFIELFVTIVGIGILVMWSHPRVAAGLFAFLMLTILYSYNFLSLQKQIATRWKTVWWGHFFVVLGGYWSLWYAGFYCVSTRIPEPSLALWGPFFLLACFSEYSLFLAESSIDSEEESSYGLRTLAALLSRRTNCLIALSMCFMTIPLLLYFAGRVPLWEERKLILLAFLPAVFCRLVILGFLTFPSESTRGMKLLHTLPDLTFMGSRIFSTAVFTTAYFFL